MSKPDRASGYVNDVTENCERVLVTLLCGLGPWKDSVYLVGGLTPRYLVKAKPPQIPPHAGTGDVDIVVELQMLADTEAYHTLEENFKKMGFERALNERGQKVSWRWQAKIEHGLTIILELLADDPERGGGKVQLLPTDGNISAMNIPHSSMVYELHEAKEVKAELLGDDGIATETIRHADIVSFTCLKAFALDQRHERKDAHDLVYCLQHFEGGPEAAAKAFETALQGKHKEAVEDALRILRKHFADEDGVEGYVKDGPVAVAKFELGEDAETREERILRQREAAELVMLLFSKIGA
jgi:hypothetical protein